MSLNPYGPDPGGRDTDPVEQPRGTQGPASSGGWVSVFALIIFVGSVWFMFSDSGNEPPIYIDDDDPTPIVIDEDNPPVDTDKVEFEGSYIVRVYQTETGKQTVPMIKLLDNDAFWMDWLKEKGVKFFTYDPDNIAQSETFIKAAKANDVNVPFIMWCKGAGKVIDVYPWDDDLTAKSLQSKLEAKGK